MRRTTSNPSPVGQRAASPQALPREHQSERERSRRLRYEPTALYVLVDRLKRKGVRFWMSQGPWRFGGHALRRRGRNNLDMIPIVTNGRAEVMVDTMEHAVDVSAFLNWAGVVDLDPVADLKPPEMARFATA